MGSRKWPRSASATSKTHNGRGKRSKSPDAHLKTRETLGAYWYVLPAIMRRVVTTPTKIEKAWLGSRMNSSSSSSSEEGDVDPERRLKGEETTFLYYEVSICYVHFVFSMQCSK